MTDIGPHAPNPSGRTDMVTGVNSVAVRPPGSRLVRVGAIAFSAVVIGWVAYAVISGKNGALDTVDLTVYRDGGLIVRHIRPYYDPHDAAPLYDWGGYSSLALKFTYPPFAAVAFALVSYIPWAPLWVASVVVNIVSLVAALWFTFGGLGYTDRRVRLGATLVAAAVTFWLQPVVRTIYLGQINLILMAAIIWDMCQPREGRWWKGAVTGIAAGIKLTPLVFVPFLLVTRKFREAAVTTAAFLATVLVGWAFLPGDSDKWWLQGLMFSDGNRTGFTGWAGNQSLRALITRLSGSIDAGTKPWLAAAAAALVLGILAAYLLERAGYHVPAILATALTGLLISPISWDHHWVWVAPGVAVAGHYAIRAWRTAHSAAGRWRARGIGALAIGIIFMFAAWPDAIWEHARNLGKFSLGFLWAQQDTNPILFSKYGDQPWYVEYHWHGFQLLWGNAYILSGMALLLILLGIGFSLRRTAPAPPAAEPSSLPASVFLSRTDRPGCPGKRGIPLDCPARALRRFPPMRTALNAAFKSGVRMRYLGAMALLLASIACFAFLTGGQAWAAGTASPSVPAPLAGPSGEKLTQVAADTWTTTVYLDTGALCLGTTDFDLLTGTPDTDTRDTAPQYVGGLACGAKAAAAHPVTEVVLSFTPAPPLSSIPESATLAVTPPLAALDLGAPPLELTLSVRRAVSAFQYAWIPVLCGVALAAALVGITMLVGVPRPNGRRVHMHRVAFWRMPLYASSAWTFGDSWATNITAVGAVVGTVLTASGTVGELLPGLELGRFSLLIALAGGITVVAPMLFGVLNYRYSRQDPATAGMVGIWLPPETAAGDPGVKIGVAAGGSIAVPGQPSLTVPAGAMLTVSAGTPGTGGVGQRALVFPGGTDIAVTPGQRVMLSVSGSVTADLVVPAGATISFLGQASVSVPEGADVEAAAETPAGEPARARRKPAKNYPREFLIPRGDEVVAAQMWSMLAASCLTVFGIGAEIGVIGWVLGYDLIVAPQWARVASALVAAAAAALVLGYGVSAIRALADTREGTTLSGARGSSFML